MPSRRQGLSLTEVLVSMAIIVLLASIVFALASSSIFRAKESDSLARLKQIGLAGSLYFESFGRWPRGVYELAKEELVPLELARSTSDAFPEGLANQLAQDQGRMGTPEAASSPIVESYVGLRAWGLDDDQWSFIENKGDSVGWLVDLTASRRPDGYPWVMCEGDYKRLLLDSAVVSRRHGALPGSTDPELGQGRSPSALFADFTADDLK